MSEQSTSQAKTVRGKKVRVFSLVLITDDADKQKVLLGLKKRGLCGHFKFRFEARFQVWLSFGALPIWLDCIGVASTSKRML